MDGAFGNTCSIRGQVTINHGASIAVGSTNQTTVAFTGAVVGDVVAINPVAAPVAGILVGNGRVSSANVIQVDVANVTTATVAAGTAVVYNVVLIRAVGEV